MINEIKQRLNLRDYVSDYCSLSKAGKDSYKCLCPFHQENTPSLHISEDKQLFHCFGCGASGDVLRFAQLYNRFNSFKDTVIFLARHLNIELSQEDKQKLFIYGVNKNISKILHDDLLSRPDALSYLMSRGIGMEEIKNYQIGFCARTYEDYQSIFRIKYNSDKIPYATKYMKDRIVFPIVNSYQEIVGFSGRAMSSNVTPKYYNSKASVAFVKQDHLYGIERIRNNGTPVIITEGFFDVINASKVCQAIGTMGIGVNGAQLDSLYNHTDTLILCFDNDMTGEQLLERTIKELLPRLCLVKRKLYIVRLRMAKDIDEYINKFSINSFAQLLEGKVDVFKYLLNKTLSTCNTSTIEGAYAARDTMGRYITQIQNFALRRTLFEELNKQLFMNKINGGRVVESSRGLADINPINKDLFSLMPEYKEDQEISGLCFNIMNSSRSYDHVIGAISILRNASDVLNRDMVVMILRNFF